MKREANPDNIPDVPSPESERLAYRLKEAREYLGLSQEFVAEQLNIPRAAVSSMETGKRKVSSLELKQLVQLYRRSYEYFLEDDDSRQRSKAVVAALYRTTENLSDTDKEQVLKFAEFLQQANQGPRTTRQ